MLTLDELIKVIPEYEPMEILNLDANISYTKDNCDLEYHEYEVKHLYSYYDRDINEAITCVEVKKC